MKRYKHNLSHYRLITGNAGQLLPVSHFEVLPGDTIQHATSALLRASPLLAPVMHRFHTRLHTFFVPYRLLSDSWEDFITGKDPAAVLPTINLKTKNWGSGAGIITAGDLADRLGLRPGNYSGTVDASDVTILAFPLMAYHLIYNEFFRDQDLVAEQALDGVGIHQCAWGKDYFTSARPWPQKGTAISLPLGDRAPVRGIGVTNASAPSVLATYKGVGGSASPPSGTAFQGNLSDDFVMDNDGSGFPDVYADLSGATSSDVRDIRVAFALQRYEEARAMYGSRYTEYLQYLGVTPSDARLQRPEYLGGGKRDISFSEVLQTAEGTEPVGTMRGHGISGLATRRYRRFFNEHGLVMTLLSVRPQSIYMDGIHRSWFRQTKEDFFQKELQLVGQQEILNGEIFLSNDGNNRRTFGFNDRYAEYTNVPSGVAGDFRTTLDFWHAGRSFASRPALNQTFTDCVPTDRIFAVPSEDTFWIAAQQRIVARRMVMKNPQARII